MRPSPAVHARSADVASRPLGLIEALRNKTDGIAAQATATKPARPKFREADHKARAINSEPSSPLTIRTMKKLVSPDQTCSGHPTKAK
jgi:hypothetical protein